MGRQYARTTLETTYNVFPTTPGAGTQNDFYLPVNNAMTMRPQPLFWVVRDAGVGNRIVQKNVGRTTVAGTLQSYLFPTQAAYILGLATTFTSSSCLNLGSFTLDHAIVRDADCVTEYRRYTGCKVSKLSLKADMSDQGYLWSMSMDIIGSTPVAITSSNFPIPSESAYPSENPYLFGQTAGNVSIGSSRSNFQSLQVDFNNVLKAFPDENPYIQNLGFFGRDVNAMIKILYKSSADRLAYEAGTKEAVSIEVNTGTHTLTMNLQTNAIFDSVEDDLPLDDFFTQMLTLTALVDPTVSTPTDFSFTAT